MHLFCRFCEVITMLSARVVRVAELDMVQQRVIECLCLCEALFPQSEFTIVFHLLAHCVHYIRKWGPSASFWMFPMERYVGYLARGVTNRSRPVAMLTRHYRFLSLAESYRPEINEIMASSPAGAAYLQKATAKHALLGPELMLPRYSADTLTLVGRSSPFTVSANDKPFLRALFRLLHPRYDALCVKYDSESKAAAAAARAAKRVFTFPSMAAWTPAVGALSDADRRLCWGPDADVQRYPRATVGGVTLRGAFVESKLKSRGSFFCVDSSPDGTTVVREYGRIHYFADVTFNQERIPVLIVCLFVLITVQVARVDVFKQMKKADAFEAVSEEQLFASIDEKELDEHREVDFHLPVVNTTRKVENRRFILVSDIVAKAILAPSDSRLATPHASRLSGKCYVLSAAECVKAALTAEE